MASQITNLTFTTELEAVNSMLAAIGESPVSDLTTSTHADLTMALNELRNATRELQSLPWKFNQEFGLAITPVINNQAWNDPDGTAQVLGIYKPPANMSSFALSQISTQIGLDVVVRPSKVYVEGGNKVLVFYDRAKNRDGFPYSERQKLWLDVIWFFDFEQMPETARRSALTVAGKRFVKNTVGGERSGFEDSDIQFALRELKRDQGEEDAYNILNDPSVSRALGGRWRDYGTRIDTRNAP